MTFLGNRNSPLFSIYLFKKEPFCSHLGVPNSIPQKYIYIHRLGQQKKHLMLNFDYVSFPFSKCACEVCFVMETMIWSRETESSQIYIYICIYIIIKLCVYICIHLGKLLEFLNLNVSGMFEGSQIKTYHHLEWPTRLVGSYFLQRLVRLWGSNSDTPPT